MIIGPLLKFHGTRDILANSLNDHNVTYGVSSDPRLRSRGRTAG